MELFRVNWRELYRITRTHSHCLGRAFGLPLSRYANPNKQHNKSVIKPDNPDVEVTRKQKTKNSKENIDPISIRCAVAGDTISARFCRDKIRWMCVFVFVPLFIESAQSRFVRSRCMCAGAHWSGATLQHVIQIFIWFWLKCPDNRRGIHLSISLHFRVISFDSFHFSAPLRQGRRGGGVSIRINSFEPKWNDYISNAWSRGVWCGTFALRNRYECAFQRERRRNVHCQCGTLLAETLAGNKLTAIESGNVD